jgi:glycosyltransferase involved in cell wall biosynthesis
VIEPAALRARSSREGSRPVIALFEYPDVFEDFYTHYGITQQAFATTWAATATHAFASLMQRDVGEVVWYTLSLNPAISEARHQVTGACVRILQSSGLHRQLWRVFYLSSHSWRWRRFHHLYGTVASYAALASAPIVRAIRADRPRVIFAQSYVSGRFDVLLLLARALGIPLVAWHAGGDPDCYLGAFVRRRTLRLADRFIASGRRERERLIRDFDVPPDRVTVILTPIDTEHFRPIDRESACSQAGLDPNRSYILFVGRLSPEKNVDALIRAFGKANDTDRKTELLIAGDGPERERLRQMANDEAPGRVRFVGWVSSHLQLVPLYNAATWLVMCSATEGFPTVIGEAMACGTPVIASDVGAVDELVLNGTTGWTFAAGDEAALRARLARAAGNGNELANMRREARRLAEARLAPEVIAAQLQACFAAVGVIPRPACRG